VRRELVGRIEGPVDAVLVVLGVNDTLELTRGARWTSELDALVSQLRPRAKQLVFSGVPPLGRIASLPQPLRSALGARARYLDALLARRCAGEPDVRHVPIALPRRPVLISGDGFHPSSLGYAAWAAELARAWPAPGARAPG